MKNKKNIPHNTIKNILTRDFILGFLISFTFVITIFALIPALPIFLAKLGSNEAEIGILVGVYGGSSLVFRLLIGRILLKYSEKCVIMFGSVLSVFSFLSYIAFCPFWPFFFVRLFQGITFACIDTAVLTFIVKVIPQSNQTRAIGYFLLATNFALAVGPSFGMFLINHSNFTVFFLTCAGLSLCTFILSWRLKRPEISSIDKDTLVHGSFLLDRKIMVPALTGFFHQIGWGAVVAFLPLYAIRFGITNLGPFFSAIAIMIIAGRTLGSKILDIYRKEKIIPTFMFTSALAMLMLTFSKTMPMFILIGAVWGTGSAFLYPATIAYSLEYAGSSRGTAVSTFRAFTDLGLALGPIFAGIILPITGYHTLFLCLALIYIINLGYFQFYVMKTGAVAMQSSIKKV
ncbi:MAG: MFS transporter [Deltaproteobacteria bacterium]|nr:MFS transporter [Deltaproteobacteria bacterium]